MNSPTRPADSKPFGSVVSAENTGATAAVAASAPTDHTHTTHNNSKHAGLLLPCKSSVLLLSDSSGSYQDQQENLARPWGYIPRLFLLFFTT